MSVLPKDVEMNQIQSGIKFLNSKYAGVNPLTRDKWSAFCLAQFDVMNEYLWEEMDDVYDKVVKSPFLVSKFLVLPVELQDSIIKNLRNGASVQNTLHEIFLSYTAEQKYPKLENCWKFPFFKLVAEIDRLAVMNSKEVFDASNRLLKLRGHKAVNKNAFLPGMLDTVTCLLVLLYDEKRVAEAMNSWKDHMGALEPYQLTILVQHAELCKEMPIEWVLEAHHEIY